MSLAMYSKEELQELSLIEMAYEFMKNSKQPVAFADLVKEISKAAGISESEMRARLAQFYTDLNIDGRFLTLGENRWGLRVWYPVDTQEEEVVAVVKSKKKKKKVVEDEDIDEIDEFEELDDEDYDDVDDFEEEDDLLDDEEENLDEIDEIDDEFEEEDDVLEDDEELEFEDDEELEDDLEEEEELELEDVEEDEDL
ncbi:DNA-directed RNA polymerase subunit delta [Neobacillus sp. 114]|uniref:DNA-directed RNA polymerase subunit delta n=1 Tax=Neobacillus sp. 114 TaxID=3048535 RepID=UPI001C22F232|nr:DNA-directed RNA polymerase subunit delta [Neobacillus sp. 114]MBU8914973.1 DNA-directed RNA polymerase subunit delta [Bacillus sp. FJAT-29953]